MSREAKPLIVGLGGTSRPGSSSEMALRAALAAATAHGANSVLLDSRSMQLPIYGSSLRGHSSSARRMIELFRRCEGIIISSPGYHGSVSGMIKNAIDYMEELRSDPAPYWEGRAVGCIACAYGWQAAGTTLNSLRTIVHALRGWPTPLGVAINSSTAKFDHHATCSDEAIQRQLAVLGQQVAAFAIMRRSVRVPCEATTDASAEFARSDAKRAQNGPALPT